MKIYLWFLSHSKQTRTLIILSVALHLLNAILGPLEGRRTLSALVGRILGGFIGTFTPVLLSSMIIAFLPYMVFRSVAEKYKRYLDYLSVILFLVTILLGWARIRLVAGV